MTRFQLKSNDEIVEILAIGPLTALEDRWQCPMVESGYA